SISTTTISGNHAETGGGAGGGLWMGFFRNGVNPGVTIDRSTISGNTAKNAGGIERNRGTITVTNTTISGNNSTQLSASGGGGITDSCGGTTPMLLVNCTVTDNTAAGTSVGGGIVNCGSTTGVA